MNQTTETENKMAARTFDDITVIGKTWARYGLNAGKMALETSATTLTKTAEWLGALAQTLGSEPKQGDKEPAASPAPEA